MEIESKFPEKVILFSKSEPCSEAQVVVDREKDVCTFKTHHENKRQRNILSENQTGKSYSNRINSVISAGEKRGDTLQETLVPLVNADPHLEIEYHLTCADKYCLFK